MIVSELLKIAILKRNNFVYSQTILLLRQIVACINKYKNKYYEKKFYPNSM